MSVPSHNLYDFIHQVTEKRFWLMYFYPWGSRALKDVTDYITDSSMLDGPSGIAREKRNFDGDALPGLEKFFCTKNFQPTLFCHDQEPLNYDLYREEFEYVKEFHSHLKLNYDVTISPKNRDFNLRYANPASWQKYWILLHSEINSQELKRYESTGRFIGAYWWSHAVISRDWYRFALHDQRLKQPLDPQKMFLIYCRDTSGSRRYRYQFLNYIDRDLGEKCQIGSFDGQEASSHSSAEYNAEDFVRSMISVVLETIFDDNRIHLTEKVLRPIACGHPFLLAAGPNSLALLRHYGFRTFAPWIDESYDTIIDPNQRIMAIVKEMKRISLLSPGDLQDLISQCREISAHNRDRFFSDSFLDQVVGELRENVECAWKLSRNLYDHQPWVYEYLWADKGLDDHTIAPEVSRLIERLFEQNQSHQDCLDDESRTNGDDIQ